MIAQDSWLAEDDEGFGCIYDLDGHKLSEEEMEEAGFFEPVPPQED